MFVGSEFVCWLGCVSADGLCVNKKVKRRCINKIVVVLPLHRFSLYTTDGDRERKAG